MQSARQRIRDMGTLPDVLYQGNSNALTIGALDLTGDRRNEFGPLTPGRCVACCSAHPLLGHTSASMQAQGDCDQGCPESADSGPTSELPSEARAR
jgi:hypothetical protein